MEFNLPSAYTAQQFSADIAQLHTQGKSVILSIGGASDPVNLASDADRDIFVRSMDSILAAYGDVMDGIDLDLESSSMAVGTWTMANPSAVQIRIIEAVQEIMRLYRVRTGRKLILTAAPENVYLQGGLSSWQATNINGGAFLPILEALKDSLDLIHPQYYNAGGAQGGTIALNGQVYYDTGDPDYLVAITETLIRGFTLVQGKGSFSGIAASKVAIGLPANNCNAAGTGYVMPDSVSLALQYLRGEIAKPAALQYTLLSSYPDLRGLMTWSINEDFDACSGSWSFAQNAQEAIGPVPVLVRTRVERPFKAAINYDLLGRSQE